MLDYLKLGSLSFLLSVWIFFACGYSYAQSVDYKIPRVVGGTRGISGDDCHTTKAEIDFAILAAGIDPKEDGIIIIIARLGRGEPSGTLVGERLRQLTDFMTDFRGFPSRRIVTAEGERVRGLGQVEVYVRGKLHTIFKMKRNKDFATGCVLVG